MDLGPQVDNIRLPNAMETNWIKKLRVYSNGQSFGVGKRKSISDDPPHSSTEQDFIPLGRKNKSQEEKENAQLNGQDVSQFSNHYWREKNKIEGEFNARMNELVKWKTEQLGIIREKYKKNVSTFGGSNWFRASLSGKHIKDVKQHTSLSFLLQN